MKHVTMTIVGVAALALSAGAARADGETIAVFTKNQTNPYFQAVRVGTDTRQQHSRPTTSTSRSVGATRAEDGPMTTKDSIARPDSMPRSFLRDCACQRPPRRSPPS